MRCNGDLSDKVKIFMSKLYLLLLFFFVIFFIVMYKSFIVKILQGKTKTLQKLHKRNTQA